MNQETSQAWQLIQQALQHVVGNTADLTRMWQAVAVIEARLTRGKTPPAAPPKLGAFGR